MSKAYWGGLRIGWVRASAPLVQRLAAIRVGVDMASPVLEQLVAVRLLRQAPYDRRRPPRPSCALRRDALVAALREHAAGVERRRCRPAGSRSGPNWTGPVSSALSRAAEDVGVRLAPGPRFGLDGTLERFLRLPFTLAAGGADRGRTPDRRRAPRPGPGPPAVLAYSGGHRLRPPAA